MKAKSKYEMEVVARVIALRHQNRKSQAYVAAALEVTDGYIGQIESPKYPSMYTMDQLNELAKIFDCSPADFHPDTPVEQVLKKKDRDYIKSLNATISDVIEEKIEEGFFNSPRYVKDIINRIKTDERLSLHSITNANITTVMRIFTDSNRIKSERLGNKNTYMLIPN